MPQIINKAIPALNTPGTDLGPVFAKYIAVIWKVLVIFGGLMVFLQLVWGALNWILSGSNPDRLKRAKDQMFNGIFGLVILVLSYAIIKLISLLTGLDILKPFWPTI